MPGAECPTLAALENSILELPDLFSGAEDFTRSDASRYSHRRRLQDCASDADNALCRLSPASGPLRSYYCFVPAYCRASWAPSQFSPFQAAAPTAAGLSSITVRLTPLPGLKRAAIRT